jgi:uncharacterized protein YkwD
LTAVISMSSACTSLGDEAQTELLVDGSDAGLDNGSDDAALRSPTGEGARAGAGTVDPAPPTLSPGVSTTAPPAAPATSEPAPETSAVTVEATTASTEPPATEPETSQEPASSAQESSSPATDLDAGEGHSYALLGELRASLQLSALARDPEMDSFARAWSQHMAETGDFAHSDGPYGENIAFTSNRSLGAEEAAALFHQLWVDSPGHYRNMTNDRFARAGVGLYRTDRGWYGTHVFQY